ncbi:KAP family NTPase [Ferrimonas balearica]|uniref:KAP family NTPase n=1 Tax=Ferrimonas balearica TaxID=44012 RepID=UPI001C97A249|nr:KAP family NTPase [Ferrimonas balearica]MBY6106821.1 KAP family NTPase [Ferrimonas balearica]
MSSFTFRKNAIIGNLDAETDLFLEPCFYESDVFKGIVNFDSSIDNHDFTRRVIVGRTGSGKTALLKQIVEHGNVKVHDSIEAENTVFEHINNNRFISTLVANGIDLRVFYKSLWLHVLLIKVINQLYRKSYDKFFEYIGSLASTPKKPYKPDIVREYLESYKSNFFNDQIVTEITEKMQHELSGKAEFGLMNASGKISDENTQKVQRETSSYVSRELIRKQKELIKVIQEEFSDNRQQLRVVISIDDLDKSWLSSSGIRYDFINALLEAFKELLDIKSVKIMISIRTDILMGIYHNNLRQDEKDQSLIYAISWNKKEIREILDLRINQLVKEQYSSSQTVSLADIFNFDVDGVRADEFIIDRTMLRPRDAIDFVNLCLAKCDGTVLLNEDIVLEAEEKYYSTRKNALVKEWLSIFPCIKDYLDAISYISTKEFKISELDEKSKNDALNHLLNCPSSNSDCERHISRQTNFDELLKVWFVVGVIGFKKSKSLTIYSSFEKQELDITDLNKTFRIHPLFYRA